jgi:replicative DNA helicase
MEENKKTFYHVSELIPSISDELLKDKTGKPENGFLRYGLPSFDRITGGLHSGDLVLIAGGEDFHRHDLCGKIVRNLAVMRKQPVLVMPFDVPPVEFIKMLVSNMTEIDRSLRSAKKIATHELAFFVASGLRKIKVSDIYFASAAENDPRAVCGDILFFVNLHPKSVTIFPGLPSSPVSGRKPDWTAEFKNLKATAKNDYAIIACIAEEQIKDIDPVSNVIFQLVDDEDTAGISALEITIKKNTHGPCGKVRLKYDPVYGTVEECGGYYKESHGERVP